MADELRNDPFGDISRNNAWLAENGLTRPNLDRLTMTDKEVRCFTVQRPGEPSQLSLVLQRGPPLNDWACAARPFGKASPEEICFAPTPILACLGAFAKLEESEKTNATR